MSVSVSPSREVVAMRDAVLAESAYGLAVSTGHACDNAEARAFYESVRDAYAEALEYAEGIPDDDAVHEIADAAPDVYTSTRMLEVVGTGAYYDTSELATGHEDIVTLAAYVLYELALDVCAVLEGVAESAGVES